MGETATAQALTLDSIDIHSTDRYVQRGYPWAEWDLLRAEAPVFWYERDDIEPFWAITRFDDIHWVGSNDKLFVNGGGRLRLGSREDDDLLWSREAKRIDRFGWDHDDAPDMVFYDKPKHTEFRNLSARAFTPASMRRLEQQLEQNAQQYAAEFLAALEEHGTIDLVENFSVKLPLATICELLGLPASDWAKVHSWTDLRNMSTDADPIVRRELSLELRGYLDNLIERSQTCPVDGPYDVVGRIGHGEPQGCPMTQQQLHGYFFLLISAGNETTRNAITGGVAALLENPDQLQRLIDDPSLVDSAAEEVLRWTSPVIQFARVATADVELGGQTIRKGDSVGLWYPSANRDERVFDNPYRFDVGRTPNYHQAFGHGAHFCLGANLARWELRAALRAIAPILPRVRLAGPLERFPHLHVGTILSQPVTLA